MELLLKFSVENIYSQIGQYDRYAIFNFYFGSEAYNLYGSTVYGHVIYSPKDRAILEESILLTSNINNDGYIILDGALKDESLNFKLKTIGFKASEINRLSTIDIEPIKKSFKSEDIKQIPNTVNIPIDSDFDLNSMQIMLYERRLDGSGAPLIYYEKQKLISLIYAINPDQLENNLVTKYLINQKTNDFYDDVILTINESKYRNRTISIEECERFKMVLSNRKAVRLKLIKEQLGIADRHLKEFKDNNYEFYEELMGVILRFEPETIQIWGWKYSIYWDFDRFIHIFLGHYSNFYISGTTKPLKTKFQYTHKDIRRLINIILEKNKNEIEKCLSEGKQFNKYGDLGYYYNGNYYTFRIDKGGKLMQFHPQG